MGTIAVIIPAYQAETFICEALDSIAAQTRRPEQIFVIDDGSTDATASRIEAWSVRSGVPVRYEKQENAGPSAARNRGIRAATTDYVALLDADDLFQPHHLETLEKCLERKAGVVLSFGDEEFFCGDKVTLDSQLKGSSLEQTETEDLGDGVEAIRGSAFVSLIEQSYIPTSGLLMNRKAAIDVGLYDTTMSYSEDCEFLMRLSLKGAYTFTREKVARKRIHDSQLTVRKNAVRFYRNSVRNICRFISRAEELGLDKDQIQTLEGYITPHADRAIYHGAIGGWQEYLLSVKMLLEVGLPKYALKPSCFVRMVYYQFIAGPAY